MPWPTELNLKSPPPARVAMLVAGAFLFPLALSSLYRSIPAPLPWLGPAIINSLIAVLVLILLIRREGRSPIQPPRNFYAFLPAIVVVFGSLLLGISSGGDTQLKIPRQQWAWIFWVPVIEECVFRVGLGAWFRHVGGIFWGAWFSAFAFGLAHSLPTLDSLFLGTAGIPLGAFLLGLVTEALWVRFNNIWPPIAFHVACNSTVVIFSMSDPRWLDWLHFLYSGG